MDAGPQLKQAQRFINARDNEAAIRLLNPYIQDNPRDIEALNLLGLASFESKQFAAASSAYLTMWSYAPNDFRAMYGMGMTLQKLGRPEEAEKWLIATLTTNPSFERASRRLNELHARQGADHGNPEWRPPSAPDQKERLSTYTIPDSEGLEAYRQRSREKARVDMMNENWHGIPWPVRALQVIIGLAVLSVFIYVGVSYLTQAP